MINIANQPKAEAPAKAEAPTKFDTLSIWLKALAEPNRLRIVDLLMQGEQCNCEMGGKLNMAPNLVSHHLRVLQEAGLLVMRRDPDDARWIHYSMDQTALAALNRAFSTFFDPARIQPRQASCAPSGSFFRVEDTRTTVR
jgi:ArsR family transcriptional regulator, arsenate/arsenite/antimonite-responsive transcriptional repressor